MGSCLNLRGCWNISGRMMHPTSYTDKNVHSPRAAACCTPPQDPCQAPLHPQHQGLYLPGCDLMHIMSLCTWFAKHHRYAHYLKVIDRLSYFIGRGWRDGNGVWAQESFEAESAAPGHGPLQKPSLFCLHLSPVTSFQHAYRSAKEVTDNPETSGQGCISKIFICTNKQ